MALTLIKNIAKLVTVDGNGKLFKAGIEMQNIGVQSNSAFLFSDKIEWIGTNDEADFLLSENKINPDNIIDAKNSAIIPGFVDSHTHIVFAGNRSDEFARRLRGATYKEIAEEGGGIQTTVRATRNASIEELYENGKKLALSALSYGTTSIEIKSGYSLNLEGEIKQLRAIKMLKEDLPMNVVSTFLGAHDFPIEYKNNRQKYIDIICNEMIPLVAEEKLAEYCDAFVDEGYYTIEQGEQIFETAKKYGLKIRMHADELADVDAAELATKVGAVSADHLLFVSDKNIELMKNAGTVATLLPGTAYFIRMPYAPARKIIDSGCITAIATDCNPGSSFTENMQLILSLSVINMKMTAEEALSAATLNGAYSINLADKTGSIEVGKNADFIIIDSDSYSDIFYHFGINHAKEVYFKGKKVV